MDMESKDFFSLVFLNLVGLPVSHHDSHLSISAHDFTFSRQVYGEHVPYGEAGDCYSAANCPQVILIQC